MILIIVFLVEDRQQLHYYNKMEYRGESKEVGLFRIQKIKDLETFHQRAVYRVDWAYTQHIIKSGNAYHRQSVLGASGGSGTA